MGSQQLPPPTHTPPAAANVTLPKVHSSYLEVLAEDLRWTRPLVVTPSTLPFSQLAPPQTQISLTGRGTDVYIMNRWAQGWVPRVGVGGGASIQHDLLAYCRCM